MKTIDLLKEIFLLQKGFDNHIIETISKFCSKKIKYKKKLEYKGKVGKKERIKYKYHYYYH